MMRSQPLANQQNQEAGFASIVIALVLITILALLTVGFAQLTRREQQNALDSGLATQANYAAETGINDTLANIRSGNITSNITSCSGNSAIPNFGADSNINPTQGVSYTCALVDLTPLSLPYSNIGDSDKSDDGRTTLFQASGLSTLLVSWGSTDNHTSYQSSYTNKFSPAAAWQTANYPAVLRFDITPLTATFSRSSLISSTYSYYLYPSQNGSPVAYSARSGTIVGGQCGVGYSTAGVTVTPTAAFPCNAAITGLPSSPYYLIHFYGQYDSSQVSISAYDTLGNPVSFSNAVAVIDVTGRAREVLKRLQVVEPLNSIDALQGTNALEAQNICKRIDTAPTSLNNLSGTTFYGMTSGITTSTTSLPCDLSP